MRSTLLALTFVCAPALARADPCMVVDADTAAAAAKLLKDATVVTYCAPCSDAAPSASKIRPKVELAARSVKLDGTEIDLAYTYVQTGKSTFTNVGLMVGCGATRVPGFIDPAKLARKPASKPAASKPCDPLEHMHGCDR
ncbi:MAG: hypothetical protein ACM31C_21955 [Acidobacteriota bacterium]